MPPLDRRDILASNIPSEIQTRITAYEILVIIGEILTASYIMLVIAFSFAQFTGCVSMIFRRDDIRNCEHEFSKMI